MAALPDGVQVLFDQETSDVGSDDASSSATSDQPRDYHQEAYPSYQRPERRGHNVQQDRFVNKRNDKTWEDDKKEGTENSKYQRLKLSIPYALPRECLGKLRGQFPGVYFHCSDNGNHDHPFSHAVTMIGTRLMQRKIKPGTSILDVYGNPNACDRFNVSQVNAEKPKHMKALVNRLGPADFIREVNKWGPFLDDEGDERYHRGSLRSMINDGSIEQYNVLHLTHTLYYLKMQDLCDALHAPVEQGGKRVAYALVHRHVSNVGSINNGEQTYVKKYVGGMSLLKQTNVMTNSTYVHPDLTPTLFSERKVWLPPATNGFVARNGVREGDKEADKRGIAWECHRVNDETWIIELVPYHDFEVDGVESYADMWDDEESLELDDYLSTPTSSESSTGITRTQHVVTIPTTDGKFVTCDIPDKKLFDHLVASCVGKPRTQKLMEELVTKANHLVNPSALFGDKSSAYSCPPDKIYDLCVSAFMEGVEREDKINAAIANLRPVLNRHANQLRLGPKYKDFSLRDLMTALRGAVSVARDVNKVARSKDVVEAGLGLADSYLQ